MDRNDSDLRLGRFWGIPVTLHWSWFLIFFLLTGSLSLGYYVDGLPGRSIPIYWVLGTLTSLLFFFAVLVHEFGHALVALCFDIPVEKISLLVFGGAANLKYEPRTAREEFMIALAGPLASLGCALLAGLFWLGTAKIPDLALPTGWLTRINFALVVFNMIPSFPLDGGRIFRSILWKLTDNYSRATHLTGYLSRLIAYGFIGFGIYSILQRNTINGIWLVFIGWFLQNSAASYVQQSLTQRSLGFEQVAAVMSREFSQVSRNASVAQLVDRSLVEGRSSVIFVEDQGRLCGMLSLSDLASLPRSSWESTPIEQVMHPLLPQAQLHPDASLLSAMMAMDQNHLALLPVVIGGLPTGLISREQLLRYLDKQTKIDH